MTTGTDPKKELARKRRAAEELKRRQYAAYRASIVKQAKDEGYDLRHHADTGRWTMTEIATGKRQVNNLILGDQSTFSLEDAARWLKRKRQR